MQHINHLQNNKILQEQTPPTAGVHQQCLCRDCVDIQVPGSGAGQQTGLVTQHRLSLQEGTEQTLLPEEAGVLQHLPEAVADVLPDGHQQRALLRCGVLGRQHQEERRNTAGQTGEEGRISGWC